MDVTAAVRDFPHSVDDFRVGRLLQHVTARARGEGLAHVLRIVLHGQHQHLRLLRLFEDCGSGLDPTPARHDDVHQDDVGLVRAGLEDGFAKIARLGHDLDVVLRLEHATEAGADDRVVVDDEDADRHVTGTSIDSVVPEPGEDSTSSRPPTRPTRSCIPSSPRPFWPGFVEAPAVVLDHGGDRAVAPREDDAHVAGLRVLDHVRQRLLRDPVERRLDLRGQAARRRASARGRPRSPSARGTSRRAARSPARARSRRAPSAGARRPGGARPGASPRRAPAARRPLSRNRPGSSRPPRPSARGGST